ncbi:hypothetical protein PR048_014217 [Dryococelus australis]|uniref:HAT C-terminal dimerisation domain-containing protein n=1 Tax=Dryococelus australis TaxID=614101 RepID=A0ABQ9HDS1_9NEOP|nr:hypothetical protein PR048_014217 [Dryococelus australis]
MAHQSEANDNVEVSDHLSSPPILREDGPLKWRKKNVSILYPHLSKIAMEFLSIPATGAASERVFSGAGNIVSYRRELLATEHVEELVLLHENQKRILTK